MIHNPYVAGALDISVVAHLTPADCAQRVTALHNVLARVPGWIG